MPRNVRNFWIDGRVDGMASGLSGGPKSKDGGFSLTIKQRDAGSIVTAARIRGTAGEDGRLLLMVETLGGAEIQTVETAR